MHWIWSVFYQTILFCNWLIFLTIYTIEVTTKEGMAMTYLLGENFEENIKNGANCTKIYLKWAAYIKSKLKGNIYRIQ